MKKLLLIDNSSLIINVLKDMFLKHNNFKIFVAKSFEEAKSLIDENKFFCSISNMVLPDALDGEIIEFLEYKKIATILLTSTIDDKTNEIIKKANIVDYILKDSIRELNTVYHLTELLLYIENLEVLVVEDSPVIASQIKNSLESLLLKVNIASNGLEAIGFLENSENIKLILTDYNMDKMNGLEMIRKLKKDERYNHIPIITMSSEGNDELKVKLFKNGATDFLQKPILVEELKTKIINIFSNIKHLNEIKKFNKIYDNNVIASSTDAKGIIKSVSKAFCKISGYEKEELIGKPHNTVRHPDMPASVFEDLWKTVQQGNVWEGEVKNLRRDGTFYWVKAIITPNFDNEGNILGYTSIREDITDKKSIYELSITDGLTSLYNRRYFNDIALSVVEDTVRENDIFAFVLLDVDNFKKYNDTYGHQEGDNALINISKILKKTFKRSKDLVFRLGGEEFGVLISAKTKDDVTKLVEKARESIEFLGIEHLQNPPYDVLTASFGVRVIGSNSQNMELESIYKEADDALYVAKENGRNRIKFS